MSPTAAIAALALFFLLSWVPGWAVARAARWRTDDLGRFWIGFTLTSVVGLLLAQRGWFSASGLAATVGLVTAACLLVSVRRRNDETPRTRDTGGRLSGVAVIAALVTFVWSWPPFETVIAASDSTMYLNAGVHLAREGSLAVAETVASMLTPADAQGIFPSVGWHGGGPFIRLPGGLLMPALTGGTATPAFFPLLPVWVAIAAVAGGASAATVVAPFFSALTVASVALFAGETLGVVAATATALTLVANFAVWWFAKFLMPEPLAAAAVWSGFVFLRRASADRDWRGALLAGALFGLAGLARTETFLFLTAAGALTWSWRRMRVPLLPAAVGFALLAGLAVVGVEHSPSHHLADLRNDIGLQYAAMYPRLLAWRRSGATVAVSGVMVVMLLAAGLAGRRFGAGFVRGVMRVAVPLAVAAAVIVYVRIGGLVVPLRQLSWVANYCSWTMLALAMLGVPIVWRRGGDAGRVAVFAWVVATLVFVLNPRVAAYQPWAIRRFLPVVIPGITVAASAALAWIATRPRRGAAAVAVALVLVVSGLELRPVLAVRARGYYAGSFALARSVADRLPEDAIVAIDSDFADVQFQVPLWLIHGRETLMLSQSGRRWRDVMRALVASGRPVYWIGNRFGTPLSTGDVSLAALEPDPELTAITPDAPADAPPSRTVRRVIPFRIYGVGIAEGRINRETSTPLR